MKISFMKVFFSIQDIGKKENLKKSYLHCNFRVQTDQIIRNRTILGINEFQRKLLEKGNIYLDKSFELCRRKCEKKGIKPDIFRNIKIFFYRNYFEM